MRNISKKFKDPFRNLKTPKTRAAGKEQSLTQIVETYKSNAKGAIIPLTY